MCFLLMRRPPPRPPLFPYTTLFRSVMAQELPNVRAALQWAEERQEAELGLRLACFARLWHVRGQRSEEHTSELQSRGHLVCRLLLEKKKNIANTIDAVLHQPVAPAD